MGSENLQLNKPHVLCFHCKTAISPEVLATRREFRTQYGIDVFKCPTCEKDFKIDPRDFLDLREQVNQGLWPPGKPAAIVGLSPNEYTPYEMIEAQYASKKKSQFGLHIGFEKPVQAKWAKVGIVALLTAAAILWMKK